MDNVEIPEGKIRELYDRCNGRRSNYLIMNDEPKEFISLLVKEGWLTPLKNGGNKAWYAATDKLISRYREVSKIELDQIKFFDQQKSLENNELLKEEVRVEDKLEKRNNNKL